MRGGCPSAICGQNANPSVVYLPECAAERGPVIVGVVVYPMKGIFVSDPYNSYGSQVAPVAPSATATAVPAPIIDRISRLDVSDSWKRKFRLIDKAGGPDLPHFRDLPFGERFTLNFNILAFIFGPFYYVLKGLWRQAILYLIAAIVLIVLFEMAGLGKVARAVGYGFAAIYALRANPSHYKKVVLGESPWL